MRIDTKEDAIQATIYEKVHTDLLSFRLRRPVDSRYIKPEMRATAADAVVASHMAFDYITSKSAIA